MHGAQRCFLEWRDAVVDEGQVARDQIDQELDGRRIEVAGVAHAELHGRLVRDLRFLAACQEVEPRQVVSTS